MSAWCDEPVATLRVDGHVHVYHGKGRLPKHFVPREQVDPHMVAEIEGRVVPQLERLGLLPPAGAVAAGAEPCLTLVFDQAGWSPNLFRQLAARGVACITWHKERQADT